MSLWNIWNFHEISTALPCSESLRCEVDKNLFNFSLKKSNWALGPVYTVLTPHQVDIFCHVNRCQHLSCRMSKWYFPAFPSFAFKPVLWLITPSNKSYLRNPMLLGMLNYSYEVVIRRKISFKIPKVTCNMSGNVKENKIFNRDFSVLQKKIYHNLKIFATK